jgi:ankyrin repeat protein
MGILCAFGFHNWDGCECDTCGKMRDGGHDWSKDCGKCARCGAERKDARSKTRDVGHDWSKDCTRCAKCGKGREASHVWAGCKCSACGKTRDEQHDWKGSSCIICGKSRDELNWELIRASVKGDLDAVKAAILEGADKNAQDGDGSTPLHMAAKAGHLCVVEYLVANNPDPRTRGKATPLHLAAGSDHFDIVKCLLAHGADKDARTAGQATPLHFAAGWASVDVVSCLLENGADKEARDESLNNEQFTPLHIAAQRGNLLVVECLLMNGADKEARTAKNETPLYLAAERGHLAVVESLLAAGANIEARTKSDWTPLHRAACSGHLAVVKCLVGRGANLEAKIEKYETPLLVAYKHDDVIDYLLANGANKEARTREGLTYAEYAERRATERRIPPEAEELYELLVQARAWGRSQKSWPSHEQYPQRKRVREIGEHINVVGGFDAMQRAAYYVNARNSDLTVHLQQFWHGIGSWMA